MTIDDMKWLVSVIGDIADIRVERDTYKAQVEMQRAEIEFLRGLVTKAQPVPTDASR